ncbi:MAG: hypothetical protein IT385_15695 [Deltaproteobacteria bacterium]|nr:hypothetical protein [Deltaproteobacteria bacterium]
MSENDASDAVDAADASDDAAVCDVPDGCAAPAPCFVERGDACASVGALALGADFGCALLGDGAVWCWGDRDWGQVGDLIVTDAPSPPARVALPPIGALAAGDEHACAVTIGGEVWCWGRNAEAQVSADGAPSTWVARPARVDLPAAARGVAAAARASCALLLDGRVACWGARLDGQALDETMRGGRVGGLVMIEGLPGASGVSAIRAGRWSACAWSNDLAPPLGATSALGDDVVRCWGDNATGQLGVGDRIDRAAPERVPAPPRLDALALGAGHACALGPARALRCWGDNDEGQLASPLGSAVDAPGDPTELEVDAIALAVGDANGCVVAEDGRVLCWGRAQDGLLGQGAAGSRVRPGPIAGVPAARDVALGRRHACAITTGDAVVCWGDGRRGQLDGAARADPAATPIAVVAPPEPEGARCVAPGPGGGEVPPGAPHPSEPCRVCARDLGFVPCSLGCSQAGVCHAAEALAVGGVERCAARSDGALVCWDDEGPTPSARGLVDVDEVALGDAWGCARAGGDVACWAAGEDAEVALADASALVVHGARACAIVAGEVMCWQAGAAPEPVPGLAAFGPAREVALTASSACALLADEVGLVCWGDDAHGELAGAAGIDGAPARVPLVELLPFDRLVGGARHLVALRDLGRVLVAWGDNRAGQIAAVGAIPTAGLATPLALRTRPARPLAAVAAGAAHTCVLNLAGRVECWGEQGLDGGPGVRAALEGATRLAAYDDTTCAVVSGHVVTCWRSDDPPVRVALAVTP